MARRLPGWGWSLSSGLLTSAELTTFYLERIGRLNPDLHAVITVSPDAMAEARASDSIRVGERPRGPLEGIPVLVKDNIAARGMPTTLARPRCWTPRRPTPSWLAGCARRARSSSARRTCRSGPTSARRTRPAAGARSAVRW
jgi:hypothetical protein